MFSFLLVFIMALSRLQILEKTRASIFSWVCNEDVSFIANTDYVLALLTENCFDTNVGEKSFSFALYLMNQFPQKLKSFLIVNDISKNAQNVLDMLKYMLGQGHIFSQSEIPVFVLCSGCLTPVLLLDKEEINGLTDSTYHVNEFKRVRCLKTKPVLDSDGKYG